MTSNNSIAVRIRDYEYYADDKSVSQAAPGRIET